MFRSLLLAVLCAAVPALAAPPRPEPLDPRAPVPALRLPVAPAVAPLEPEAVPWRAANDRVARVGGWRAYAREAAASAPKEAR